MRWSKKVEGESSGRAAQRLANLAMSGEGSSSAKLETAEKEEMKPQESELVETEETSQHEELINTQYLELQERGETHTAAGTQVVKVAANGQLVVSSEMLQHVTTGMEGDHPHMVVHVLPPHGELKDTFYTPVTTAQQLQRAGAMLTEERYITEQLTTQHYEDDLLAHDDLTEEDRRLAAALMAVQYNQQQKQQQHISKLLEPGNIVCTSSAEGNVIMSVTDSMQNLIASNQLGKVVDASQAGMGDMVVEYIQQVDAATAGPHDRKQMRLVAYHTEGLQTATQPLPSLQEAQLQPPHLKTITHAPPLLKKALTSQLSPRARYKRLMEEDHANTTVLTTLQGVPPDVGQPPVKHEDEEDQEVDSEDDPEDLDFDAEGNARSARRSLPHKKRISRKLKNPPKKTTGQEKLIKCPKCEETFLNQPALNAHKQSVHNKKLLFNCELCGKNSPNQLKFFEHLKSHYEPLPQAELPTTDGDLSVESLKEPVPEQSHPTVIVQDFPPALPPPLACPHCGKIFRRQNTLERHINVVHAQPVQQHQEEEEDMLVQEVEMSSELLPEDDETLKKGPWYTHHELTAVPLQEPAEGQQKLVTATQLAEIPVDELAPIVDEFPVHMCDHCGDNFELRSQLLVHLKEEHPEVKRPPKPPPRPKVKKDIAADIAAAVVSEKNRKWEQLTCPTCGRMFNHRNSLVYHLRSHTGERPHQCEVCGKSFFAASALKVHMRLHSGDKPYKCELCGRHFRQWGDLKYHCISLHTDEKQYQCEYCGKDFARKYSLIVHRRIHTGEKNYKCEFCSKTFRASSYLQNHRRIHTGEKPHPCDVCGKPFRVRSDMKRHMQTHTRDREGSGSGALARPVSHSQSSQSGSEHHAGGHDLNSSEMDPVAAEITIPESEHEEVAAASAVLEAQQSTSGGGGTSSEEPHTPLGEGESQEEGGMQYPRDPLETVRDSGGNTLYVWPIYMA